MNKISRSLIAIAALSLIFTWFVPLWIIELSAPQYPEGLVMEIWTFKLGGDVDVVNGLNHYIGMATMHTDDFIEFTILPYLIVFTIVFGLIVAISGKKNVLYTYTIWVILFGIVAMADFYRWEYDYGHNLDPNAPIQVPGMTYQPPFIGYKQLLNFGAFSIPALGGFLFILNALVVVTVAFFAWKKSSSTKKKSFNTAIFLIFTSFALISCSKAPKPIEYGKEPCSYCKMTIVDARFGGKIISKTGKQYNFDDVKCIIEFIDHKYITEDKIESVYVIDYYNKSLAQTDNSTFLIYNQKVKSPMASGVAVFTDQNSLNKGLEEFGDNKITWHEYDSLKGEIEFEPEL